MFYMYAPDGSTPVSSHCAICGNFNVPAREVTVHVPLVPHRPWCVVQCPTCNDTARVDLDMRTARLLIQVGAKAERAPEELFEEHTGPPISEADIEAFIAKLEQAE